MKTKKIILYLNNLETGGVETAAANIARVLKSHGDDVYIVYQTGEVQQSIQEGVHLIKIYPGKIRRTNIIEKILLKRYDPYTKPLKTAIAILQPDVIIAFNHAPIISLLLAKPTCKTVGSIHGYYRTYSTPSYIRRNLSKLSAVTVLTKENLRHFSSYNANTFIKYNPLGLPICEKVPKKRKEIICVTRLNTDKVPDLFIKASAIAKTSLPDYEFIIAGDGPTRDSLEQINRDLGSPVKFAGNLPKEELSKLYSSAETLVLCSKAECFPNVLLESANQYVCRVSTRFIGDGLYDLIDDGENGLIAELTPESIAQKILLASTNSELRNKLIKNAKQLVERIQAKAEKDWVDLIHAEI